MSRRDPSQTNDLLASEVAALEELLTVQEETVARQTAKLVRATELAQEATRAKSEFLANMSHELRTPLNSVIGFSNILLKNKTNNLAAEQLTYLKRIQENGKHLLSLINSILDLSKIEAGHLQLETGPVALVPLVRETVEQLRGQATNEDLELLLDVPATVPDIQTDSGKLKQVIINLAANAIRFTSKGSVIVRVVRGDAPSPRSNMIEIVDTGIGIPKEKIQSIFEAFEQADSSTSREFGGTGLGLAISKSLCDLMGHRLEVESEVGRGSTFRIVLGDPEASEKELARSPQSTRVPEESIPAQSHEPDRQDLTVLVIDDEADSRLLLSAQLEEFGARVIAVSSGTEGLRLARVRRPDVITLDLMMPDMHGIEVLQALKADAELRSIPVIVVSIVAEEYRSTLLGTVEHLSKPVSREDLGRVLQDLARLEPTKVLVVEDDADTQQLLQDYLEERGLGVRIAANGREALAMLEHSTPDLITLDLFMPEMDGFEFLVRLRADQRHADLPVIVLTAATLTSDDRKRLAVQAQAVLEKGKDITATLQTVLRSLRNDRLKRPH